MKNIKIVGVVGCGTMGAALAQKFAQEEFKVILADQTDELLAKGLNNIKNSLFEGIEKKIFSEEKIIQILNNIVTTSNLEELSACDLVVEAIYENFDAKKDLFTKLSKIVNAQTILATNTSSYSVTELAEFVSNPERFVGLHYFYHAAKNRLVEIIPGKLTSSETISSVESFSILTGKDAIQCKDAYGFVVNRYFVPWLNESVRLLEENIANIATIDYVCRNSFGIGMGPFALMNATGVPVAYHAQKTLEVFGDLYKVSNALKEQVDAKQNWIIEGEIIEDINIQNQIKDRMLGIEYFVCSQILDEEICTAVEINRGARIGLQWRKGPIELMQQSGIVEVQRLINLISKKYNAAIPVKVGEAFWKMPAVSLKVNNNSAVITLNQPESLNALNEQMMQELDEKISDVNANDKIDTVYITGSGKAFVAGADIKFFIKNIKANSIHNIISFTEYGQKVFSKIDNSSKKVIAIINGLALGGGLELALCADVIVATSKSTMAFPETSIGIYPGLGGTWRSKRKIGKSLAKYLVSTGKKLNAQDAKSIGLVDDVITLEESIEILNGLKAIRTIHKDSVNHKWNSALELFDKYSIQQMLQSENELDINEEQIKIVTSLKSKAPLALQLTEEIMESNNESNNELNNLEKIFNSSDALLGLSNIGKSVQYKGK